MDLAPGVSVMELTLSLARFRAVETTKPHSGMYQLHAQPVATRQSEDKRL